jgi:trehalose 6-phosphate phosphatase
MNASERLGTTESGSVMERLVAETASRLPCTDRILLFLDFDGTLAPIEADPETPQLDDRSAAALRLLASLDSVVTTIISGRAVEDLYSRIHLDDVIYAGNHGLEIFGRDLRFVSPEGAAAREPLARLCEELSDSLQPFGGVMVEYKGLTASVHFRRAAVEDRLGIENAVRAVVCRAGGLFRLNLGRKVFEIMPRSGWHKGMAVRWIEQHVSRGEGERRLSIYLGDDSSDEEAFSVMPGGITVKVGVAQPTLADYRLPDPSAVHEYLRWLAIRCAAPIQNR